VTTDERLTRVDALWRNCADSIMHALHHFRAIVEEGDDFHNRKWAILSLHHASEVFCNILLVSFDATYPDRRGYRSLTEVIRRLRESPGWCRLSKYERLVIARFLGPLSAVRNRLMHREAPDDLEITKPAVAALALLHLVRRRTGASAGAEDFVDQDPPVELDVLESVRFNKCYRKLLEQLTIETYGRFSLDGCDSCGSLAIPHEGRCEVCFEEFRRPTDRDS
jgi:hypothetical protein